jgi:hypothetical protein
MSEIFDTVATNPASGGTKLSGEQVVQSGVTEFLPACYLIYGPKGGPYNRVDVSTGLPVQVENSPSVSVSNFPATQNVSGTVAVSNFPGTQPVSGTVTANQGGAPWQENLTQVGGGAIALGQAAMAASLPVVIASNQGNVPVSVQNFPATQTVSGTVAVSNFPGTQAVSGTVTVNQGTSQWVVNLDQVNGSTVSLGQKTMANSFPVVLPSDQTVAVSGGNAAAGATGSAVPSSADYAGLNVGGTLRGWTGVNPTGSVYAGQTDLASVGGTSFALGSHGSAGSIPVVIASDQGTIPVSATVVGTVSVSVSGTAQVGLTTWGGNTVAGAVAPSDALNAGAAAEVDAFKMAYNGSTWDQWRNNAEGTALASATRTATTTSAAITNHNCRGIIAFLNVTAASGTGGLGLVFLMVDPVSGNTAKISTTSGTGSITATGQYLYMLGPGASTGATATDYKLAANGQLPRTFKVQVTHADGSNYTYSVGYSLIQ